MTLVLVDTSLWARLKEPKVGEAVARAIDANAVVMTPPVLLELLRSARTAAELDDLALEYGALHQVDLSPAIARRALEVQALLAKRGHHRGPSPVDLLAAAAAEASGAEIWHRDGDFEVIAKVTGQPHRKL
jgi:predicted nucleic acid-binding protein